MACTTAQLKKIVKGLAERHVAQSLGGDEHETFDFPAKETLHNALLLSSEHSGEILLACPEAFDPARKVEEWTYCKIVAHGQNIRFGSLYMMLSYLIDRSLETVAVD